MAMGCGIGERKVADLQLDVEGAPLVDTDRIRVCIEDTLIHETALGDGRLAVAGIPTDAPIRVVISDLDETMRAGGTQSVRLGNDQPWAVTAWTECETACAPCSIEQAQPNNTQNNTGLLTIHFLD
tara:strand:+ start:285 stop:662 length:378 start_codon:yes stop_codon:yes gene_type:complete